MEAGRLFLYRLTLGHLKPPAAGLDTVKSHAEAAGTKINAAGRAAMEAVLPSERALKPPPPPPPWVDVLGTGILYCRSTAVKAGQSSPADLGNEWTIRLSLRGRKDRRAMVVEVGSSILERYSWAQRSFFGSSMSE